MSALKPCPFCGGEAKDASHESCDCCGKPFNGTVTCLNCEGEVSHYDTAEAAAAAWNRRADNAIISQARAEGRREGLEEAAQLVENQGAELHGREDDGIDRFDAAMILAAGLREIAQKEGGKNG